MYFHFSTEILDKICTLNIPIFTGGGGRDGPRLEDERERGDDDRVGPLLLVVDGL